MAVSDRNRPGHLHEPPRTYGSLAIPRHYKPLTDRWDSDHVNFLNFNSSTFNPTLFALTNQAGEVYVVDEKEGLKSMADRNGNELLVSTNGVIWTNALTGGPALGISFIRDGQGHIKQIVDPMSNSL